MAIDEGQATDRPSAIHRLLRRPGGDGRLRRVARVASALTLAAAASVAAPNAALAHPELASSKPAANETLPESPPELTLNFTEPVAPTSGQVGVLSEDETPVDGLGGFELSEDGRRVRLDLPPLAPGVYTVRYRVLSAVDGHLIVGSFLFQVDPTGTAPPPLAPPASASPSSDVATALSRWLALASALTLFGLAVFWLFSGRPALRELGLSTHRLAIWRAMTIAGFGVFAGLGIFLSLAASDLGAAGSPGRHHDHFALDFAGPFGWTPFANAMRVAEIGGFGALLLGSAWFTAREDRRAARSEHGADEASRQRGDTLALTAMLVLGAVTLGAFSAVGHASALGGPLFAVLDWVHLLAVAVWMGTLPGILLFYLLYVRRQPPVQRRPLNMAALRRHSRVAGVVAPLVALTGIANSQVVLGSGRDLISTDYGNLLIAKALLFSVALAIGSANFLLLRRATPERVPWLVASELAVGAIAVLTAASLVSSQPPPTRASEAVVRAVDPAHLIAEADGSLIHAVVTVPSPGPQLYQVAVIDPVSQRYQTDVDGVTLVFTPPGEGAPRRVVATRSADEPGLFQARGSYTPSTGEWALDVGVDRQDGSSTTVEFDLEVLAADQPRSVPPEPTGFGVPPLLAAAWGVFPPWPWALAVPGFLFGAGLAMYAAHRRAARGSAGGRRSLAALRLAAISLGVVTSVIIGSDLVVRAANRAPRQAAAIPNPIPPTEDSIARGRATYLASCAACHGTDGAGDGPAAAELPRRPEPLSAAVARLTDGELYHLVTNGTVGTEMPAFAADLSDDQRWEVVSYLRHGLSR